VSLPPPSRTHELRWDSLLQDCLDDSLDADARAELEAHLTGCTPCSHRQADLRRIDQALCARLGHPRLDESFDRRLLALVDAQPTI
jgi:anti-sigma factor RsiW